MINIRRIRLVITLFLCTSLQAIAQTDTLRVMAYNVLYYGDRPACQGPHDLYHNYLKTIAGYANADIIGLEKMAAIPAYPGDVSGSAPAGFGDSILFWALNAAYAGRYACCPFTNASGGDNISMLFYDQQKLGFLSIASSYSNITDFNTYLLYYKSPGLATTHDTIFLYITLNHDNSGSGSSDATIRGNQIQGEMAQIATHFSALLPMPVCPIPPTGTITRHLMRHSLLPLPAFPAACLTPAAPAAAANRGTIIFLFPNLSYSIRLA